MLQVALISISTRVIATCMTALGLELEHAPQFDEQVPADTARAALTGIRHYLAQRHDN